MQITHSIWAIVPAAGIGKRMQSDIPKQYLSLNGRPVLEYTINTLLKNKNISGLIIALQEDDSYWSELKIDSPKPVIRTKGGKERADSVLNAIDALFQFERFNESDWVMVHDAVRPCLQQKDINKLVSEVGENENGGLLALPVRDTMKRQKNDSTPTAVDSAIDRENPWHALTPQYFPAAVLHQSLKMALQKAQENALDVSIEKAKLNKMDVTDESSAMEFAGYSPMLIQGAEDNIKITRPDDLRLAGLYLQAHNDKDQPSG